MARFYSIYRYIRIVFLASIVLFTIACRNGNYPHVSQVSESYLELKTNLGLTNLSSMSFNYADIETRIDDFQETLNGFLSSPVAFVYEIHMPESMLFLRAVTSDLDDLKTAVKNGTGEAIFPIAFEIDRAIEQLWQTESRLSKKSQLDYFQLFFFFSMLVISSVFLFWGMYNWLEKAKSRERKILAYPRETVMAQEQERRRISCELHDTVLPFVNDPSLSDTIRSICMELMPPDFSLLSLKDSLADLCAKFAERTGIQCVCSIEKELAFTPITSENQLHIYRMIQEAFNNIEKHSQTDKAVLLVRRLNHGTKKSILICVSDEGIGLTPGPLRSNGSGLGMNNMRHRASFVGAKLDFISETGHGLMVRIEIPLESSNG